jgi:Asp-tRNA(Asn)/Glu-tRNA(Gln) amidotransferase A subunit family amidase
MTVSRNQSVDLTHLSAVELARAVRAGELSAAEVVEAHIRRCREVHLRLNALVVPRFEEARREAAGIDDDREAGRPLGPLAGVPITIKEQFYLRGTQATIGITRYVGQPTPDEGPLVARLRQAGAVILGKTNLPQLMVTHECDNPVYGRANNPWDERRSPGGSSGGEAAIVAAGGSALGLASDIGGSIRQPAHSCGVYGLKPTSGRLTLMGSLVCLHGMEAFVAQPGPIARTVEDLELAMRVLAAEGLEAIDPQIPPVPWRDSSEVDLVGLRVAMWTDDGYFRPSPAIRRAVEDAAAALRARGAIVERFSPPEVAEGMRLFFSLLSADGGADGRRMLRGTPIDPQVRHLLRLGGLPLAIRRPLAWTLDLTGQRQLARLVRSTGAVTADRYWQLTYARALYEQRFIAALDAGGYEAMLCPPFALPAVTHGSFANVPGVGSYCMLFNLLGFPAGVAPATRVRVGEESDRAASRDRAERMAVQIESGSAGLPIGVQVAGRLWREDVVLALMGALEAYFRGQPDYPDRPPL